MSEYNDETLVSIPRLSLRPIGRALLAVLCSTIFVPFVVWVSLGLQIYPLAILLLPGLPFGFAYSRLDPHANSGGGWFGGLFESVFVAVAVDWVFYAAVAYFLLKQWGRDGNDLSADGGE